MARLKVSVVVSVRNEAESITRLLDSLKNQTAPANEILIVDANSSDSTIDEISEWAKVHVKINLRVIKEGRINRSKARNIGIRHTKNELIAITDAGCAADQNWLEELCKCKTSTVDAVGGFYRVKAENDRQRIFEWYLATDPKTFNPQTYLPSSRSLLLTKAAWLKVGGYPEKLDTCEDLVLAVKLKKMVTLISTDKALVYWQIPKSWRNYFKAVVGYSKGDVEAFYLPHVMKLVSVFARYLIMYFFPLLIVAYLGLIIIKHRKKFTSWKQVALVVPVQIITDLAVIVGSVRGTLGRISWLFGRS